MVTKSTEIGHSYEMRWDKGKKTLGTRWMGRKVRREGKEGHPLSHPVRLGMRTNVVCGLCGTGCKWEETVNKTKPGDTKFNGDWRGKARLPMGRRKAVAGWRMATGDPPPQQCPGSDRGGLLLQAACHSTRNC
jgi:hypothetical protein